MEVGPDGLLYFPVMGANEIWRIDPDGRRAADGRHRPRRSRLGQVRPATASSCRPRWPAGRCCASIRAPAAQTVLAQLTPGLDNCTFVGDRLFVSNFTGEITEVSSGGETTHGAARRAELAAGSGGRAPTARLYVADGTYFYAVQPGRLAADRRACCSRRAIPGFLRGLAARRVPASSSSRTSGGQIAPLPPGRRRKRRPRRRFRPALRRRRRGRATSWPPSTAPAGWCRSIARRRVEVLATGLDDPRRRRRSPDGDGPGRRVGRRPRRAGDRVEHRDRGRRAASARRASWPTVASCSSSTPAPRP